MKWFKDPFDSLIFVEKKEIFKIKGLYTSSEKQKLRDRLKAHVLVIHITRLSSKVGQY